MTTRRGRFEKPCLSATIRDATILSRMLRSIEISKVADVIISSTGLIFRTDMDHNNMQAKAFINANLFDAYDVNEELLDGPGAPDDDDSEEGEDDSPAQIRTRVVVLSLRDLLICLDMYGGGGTSSTSSTSFSRNGVPPRQPYDRDDEDPFLDDGASNRRGGYGGYQGEGRSRSALSNGAGSSPKTAVKIVYDGQGSPFTIQLDEGKRVTTCKLVTNEPQEGDEVGFSDEDKIVRVVLESKEFAEAIRSIDPSSRSIEVGFFPRFPIAVKRPHAKRRGIQTTTTARDGNGHLPSEDDTVVESSGVAMARSSAVQLGDPDCDIVRMMRLTAEGDAGSAEVQLPFDAAKPLSEQLFTTFEADIDTKATYHFKYFAHAYTALSTASKTSIRLQPNGVMSIQCIFPPSTDERVPVEEELTRNGFVDMLIAPLASDEDGLE